MCLHFVLKANANTSNNFGKFPLHIAVEHNLLDIVTILLDAGADVDAGEQVSGKTPLHLAIERSLEDMVQLLVREGQADLSRQDFSGVSPADQAEHCKSTNIKKILAKEMRKYTS